MGSQDEGNGRWGKRIVDEICNLSNLCESSAGGEGNPLSRRGKAFLEEPSDYSMSKDLVNRLESLVRIWGQRRKMTDSHLLIDESHARLLL